MRSKTRQRGRGSRGSGREGIAVSEGRRGQGRRSLARQAASQKHEFRITAPTASCDASRATMRRRTKQLLQRWGSCTRPRPH
jgi:hypothetical protein